MVCGRGVSRGDSTHRPARLRAARAGARSGAQPRPSPGVHWRLHFWLAAPVQSQMVTVLPLAVPLPATSRHRPEPTPVMVQSVLSRQCWLVWPLQSQMIAELPLAVAAP